MTRGGMEWRIQEEAARALARQQVIAGWYVTAWQARYGSWTGLAKREPFMTGCVLSEPGDLWFEFGSTKDEAIAAVLRDVGAIQ